MKSVLLGIALIACLPVFAQDQLAIKFLAFKTSTGVRISGTLHDEPLVGTATSIQGDGALHVARLKGNVEISINGMKLQADEVDLHWDSGEIEPRGNVRLKPLQ
jgi:lipopolysaccharide assembly outer membrane protein LptD (OstA)